MPEHTGILIVSEVRDRVISKITCELLGIGRKLADDLGSELGALILGKDLGALGREAIAFGADKVYLVDHPLLADYHSDVYTEVITKSCQQLSPAVLLLGQTNVGRDLAPRLAWRLGGEFASGCIELSIDRESSLLSYTRPVYGGNANATFTSSTRPQIVTMRPRSGPIAERNESKQGKIVTLDPAIDVSVMRYKVIDKIKEEAVGAKLEDAEVVVAGGRGIGGKEGFNLIWDLAKSLGAAVGASMPPCKQGWIAADLEIGQTGKIIGPNLYIAVAISGAPQHVTGCMDSKNIVAVNRDPEAQIFKVADYGVVGDYKEALPAFIEKVKELRESH